MSADYLFDQHQSPSIQRRNKKGYRKYPKPAHWYQSWWKERKIHAVVDALGNPIHIHLSAGNCHDSTHTQEALSDVPIEVSTVLPDKAYGAKSNRTYIASDMVISFKEFTF